MVRLWTTISKPLRAMLRARFAPIVASPVSPKVAMARRLPGHGASSSAPPAAYESVRPEIVGLVPAARAPRARPRLRHRLAGRGAEGARRRRGRAASSASPSTRARPGRAATAVIEEDVEALARRAPRSSAASTAWSPPTCSSTSSTRGARWRPTRRCSSRAAARSSRSPTSRTGRPTRRSRAGAGRAGPRASTTPPTCAGSRCATRSSCCEGAGLRVEHVERRPWVLWRGTRLDRRAGRADARAGARALRVPARARGATCVTCRAHDGGPGGDLQGLRRPRPVRRARSTATSPRRSAAPSRACSPASPASRPPSCASASGATCACPRPSWPARYRDGHDRRGRARARRRAGRHGDALFPRRLARPRRRADVHRLAQPRGVHGREAGRARRGRAVRRRRASTRCARLIEAGPRRRPGRRLRRGGRRRRRVPRGRAGVHRPRARSSRCGSSSTAATAWPGRWSGRCSSGSGSTS